MAQLEINHRPAFPRSPRPIVIIGAGGIVRQAHLPAYTKARFPVVGLFDIDVSKARSLAGEFGVPQIFSSLEETVKNAPGEAVFDIAVPASAILEILPLLPDACGVLIQKPLGENLEQAQTIRDLCQRKRLVAAVNFQLRYAPYVLAARSLIEQGAIGELHDMEIRVTVFTPWHLWKFLEKISRVEILYHSIHYLDLLRSFLGEPRGIYAKTVKHPKTPHLAATRSNIILDYGETLRANIATNHGHEFGLGHQESYIKWEGTRGAIVARMGLLMNYPKGEPDEFEYCVAKEGSPTAWQRLALEGSWFPDAFIGTMSSLMRFLEKSSNDLPSSVDDALRTMALVEAAYQSSERGATAISPG